MMEEEEALKMMKGWQQRIRSFQDEDMTLLDTPGSICHSGDVNAGGENGNQRWEEGPPRALLNMPGCVYACVSGYILLIH